MHLLLVQSLLTLLDLTQLSLDLLYVLTCFVKQRPKEVHPFIHRSIGRLLLILQVQVEGLTKFHVRGARTLAWHPRIRRELLTIHACKQKGSLLSLNTGPLVLKTSLLVVLGVCSDDLSSAAIETKFGMGLGDHCGHLNRLNLIAAEHPVGISPTCRHLCVVLGPPKHMRVGYHGILCVHLSQLGVRNRLLLGCRWDALVFQQLQTRGVSGFGAIS
jgi:hypothetical protein